MQKFNKLEDAKLQCRTQLNDALNEPYPSSRLVNSDWAHSRSGPGFARHWPAQTQLKSYCILRMFGKKTAARCGPRAKACDTFLEQQIQVVPIVIAQEDRLSCIAA
jgi:hypothetical protein